MVCCVTLYVVCVLLRVVRLFYLCVCFLSVVDSDVVWCVFCSCECLCVCVCACACYVFVCFV